MKAIINILILIIIIVANYLTGIFKSAGDGWDIIGFPFIFYKSTAAKLDLTSAPERNYFSPAYLIADILFSIAILVFANFLYRRFRKRYKKAE